MPTRTRSAARHVRFLLVLAASAAGLLLVAGTARADDAGTPCPPGAKAPQVCITISDTDGVSASPNPATNEPPNYMRYVVTVENVGGRTLKHALLTTALADFPLGGDPDSTATLVSLTSSPAGSSCRESSPGVTVCDLGRLPAGAAFTATFVYTTSYTEGIDGTRMTATVSLDKPQRGQTEVRAPSAEVREVANDTVYETRADFGSTFVPAEAASIRVVTSLSSLEVPTPGPESFFAEIQDYAVDRVHCFKGVKCLPQTTRGDLTNTGGGLGPFLWERRITDVPKGVSASSIDSVHFSDPVPVLVDPASDTFTSSASFLAVDGVRFSTGGTLPGGLRAGTDYFVVKATSTSFKVSARKGGKPLDIKSAGSGPLHAERIRVIGDAKSERWTSCVSPPPVLPAIAARQVSKTVVDTCVWTEENGWMK